MPVPEKKQKMLAARLTKREKQVLQLIVQGKTSRQIAVELDVSPLTIKTHAKVCCERWEP
jgi:DNA-binding CsgD family transcriptional regulator